MSNLIKVISELPKLKPEELATVKAAIEHLLLRQNAEAVGTEQTLFDTLIEATKAKISFQQFKRTSAYKDWAKYGEGAATFIDSICPGAKRVVVMALSRMLIEALSADLSERKVPVSLGSLASNLGRFPQIFEQCYPGYQASGMTHLIVKKLTMGSQGILTEGEA